MQRKIKWGVLGYANIAKNATIPAIFASSNSEFYAIASRSTEKLNECFERFGCKKVYSCYEELLEDRSIDAVYIPLPNSLHKEWAIKALNQGKHVLCEKPLALDPEDCDEMIHASKRNHVNLMEGFMYRYSARTEKVKELISNQVLGSIRQIHTSFGFMVDRKDIVQMDPALGGGCLHDVGCYGIDFLTMITGEIPVLTSAQCVQKNGVDISFSALLNYGNGTLCTIHSWFNAFTKVHTEIIGTEGILKIPSTYFGTAGNLTIINKEGTTEINIKETKDYVLQIEDFCNAILYGRQPAISLEETRVNTAIIAQLRNQALI